jgi:Zn-dependent peptidase ImmA (M78 family)
LPWIKKIVQDLTKKYNTNNPYELAAFKNVQVILWDLHEEIKGFYKYDKRNKYIFINNNLDESSQKFVCAHELGHSQLHPRVNTPFLRANTLLSTDKIEREANRFAVELLIPDEILYEFQDSNLTINEVAAEYGIPKETVSLKII